MQEEDIRNIATELGISEMLMRIPGDTLLQFVRTLIGKYSVPSECELERMSKSSNELQPADLDPKYLADWLANRRPSIRDASIMAATARQCEAQNPSSRNTYDLNVPAILAEVPLPKVATVYTCKNAECVFQSCASTPCNLCDGRSHFLAPQSQQPQED